MDENQLDLSGYSGGTTADSGGSAWWEDTLNFVVRAAAVKQFSSPKLQNGQSYYVDANGQVLAMGQQVPLLQNQNAAALLSSPMVMLAGLALVGVLLYKLVK
jgi:hypothetical protein